jgi:2,4-dienoyl-CoA reductase-like NADH-dependent reductase (Old Yellow Enzyme family)
MYENLLEPIELGPARIPNRIFNPPHGTTLGSEGVVTDNLIAYHEARAKGGVGLIILEGMICDQVVRNDTFGSQRRAVWRIENPIRYPRRSQFYWFKQVLVHFQLFSSW